MCNWLSGLAEWVHVLSRIMYVLSGFKANKRICICKHMWPQHVDSGHENIHIALKYRGIISCVGKMKTTERPF